MRNFVLALLAFVATGCSYFVGEPVCGKVEKTFRKPFRLLNGDTVSLGMTVVVLDSGRIVLQLKGKPPKMPMAKDSSYIFYPGLVHEIAMDVDSLRVLNGLYFEEKRGVKPVSSCRKDEKP